MKTILAFLVALAWCALTFPSLPVAHSQNKTPLATAKLHRANKAIAGQYIVVLNNGLAPSSVTSVANNLMFKHGGKIKYVYEHALKGFALSALEAEALALSRDPLVAYVEEVGEVVVTGVQQPIQSDASVFGGLDRIDQRDLPLNSAYQYNRVGSGVHVYVIDTGIRLTQHDFGTRATAVYDFARPSTDPRFGYTADIFRPLGASSSLRSSSKPIPFSTATVRERQPITRNMCDSSISASWSDSLTPHTTNAEHYQ